MTKTPIATDIPHLLTCEELAAKFGISEMQLYRLSWAGKIPSVKIGRLRRFAPAAIAAMIENGGTLDQAA